MNNVEFENDINSIFYKRAGSQNHGMIGWLIKRRLAKDRMQAEQILLVIFALNILLSIFIVYYFTF